VELKGIGVMTVLPDAAVSLTVAPMSVPGSRGTVRGQLAVPDELAAFPTDLTQSTT
jgi:hypothetical protein